MSDPKYIIYVHEVAKPMQKKRDDKIKVVDERSQSGYFKNRNMEIARRVLGGDSLKDVAAHYKISGNRVRVIVFDTLAKVMEHRTSFMVKLIGLKRWRELYKTDYMTGHQLSGKKLW